MKNAFHHKPGNTKIIGMLRVNFAWEKEKLNSSDKIGLALPELSQYEQTDKKLKIAFLM